MGTDVHVTAERWNDATGKWEGVSTEFVLDGQRCYFMEDRNYAAFGWLANVRNYAAVPPLAEVRGYPDDWPVNDRADYHDTVTWFAIGELLDFDFDQPVENRRVTREVSPGSFVGNITAEPGEGEMTTYRELFGEFFMAGLAAMKENGAERLIFSFDS
jgi:hypothetical protein